MLKFERGAAADAKVEDAGALIVWREGKFFWARICGELRTNDRCPPREYLAVGKSIATHRFGYHAIDHPPDRLGAIGTSLDTGTFVVHVGIEDKC